MTGIVSEADVRLALNLSEDEPSTERLQYYIDLYEVKVKNFTQIKDVNAETSLEFKDAVIKGIGCEISTTNPSYITEAVKYTLEDLSEEFGTIAERTPTLCQMYQTALTDLLEDEEESNGVETFRRVGMSQRRGWNRGF